MVASSPSPCRWPQSKSSLRGSSAPDVLGRGRPMQISPPWISTLSRSPSSPLESPPSTPSHTSTTTWRHRESALPAPSSTVPWSIASPTTPLKRDARAPEMPRRRRGAPTAAPPDPAVREPETSGLVGVGAWRWLGAGAEGVVAKMAARGERGSARALGGMTGALSNEVTPF